MNTHFITKLVVLPLWLISATLSAEDGLSDIVELRREHVRIELFYVQFQVFELINDKLAPVEKKFEDIFPKQDFGGKFYTKRYFNQVSIRDQGYCILSSYSFDVPDFYPFYQCPILPSENDIVKMQIKTKGDFIKQLGIPSNHDDDFSYCAFFNVQQDGTRFCWILLAHASQRCFVG